MRYVFCTEESITSREEISKQRAKVLYYKLCIPTRLYNGKRFVREEYLDYYIYSRLMDWTISWHWRCTKKNKWLRVQRGFKKVYIHVPELLNMFWQWILLADWTVKIVEDLAEWWKYMGSWNRHVWLDEIWPYKVSTVFLWLDHGFWWTPLWFETMVFLDWDEVDCERYETIHQAWQWHINYIKKYGWEKSKHPLVLMTLMDEQIP